MTYNPKQRDIIIIDFDPSKGYEINKRRPALVMSSDDYNRSTNLVIVCPITSTKKERPFFIPITSDNLRGSNTSKVNTNQVFSLDYTKRGKRNIKYIDTLEEEKFYEIVQMFMHNFSFKIFEK